MNKNNYTATIILAACGLFMLAIAAIGGSIAAGLIGLGCLIAAIVINVFVIRCPKCGRRLNRSGIHHSGGLNYAGMWYKYCPYCKADLGNGTDDEDEEPEPDTTDDIKIQ